MAKRETQSPGRGPTRKQVARSRKEREQLRLIYMGLGLVAVLVLIVLGFGLLQTFVIEPNSPVAMVNQKEITTRDYQNRVRYERFILEDILQQIQTEFQALPPAEEGDQFTELIRNQYQQQANQILQQRSIVDRQTVDIMVADKLIEAEAQKRGITASDEEVTETINRFLAGRAGGLTAQAASETSTARAEASATAASWTPTPTFTPSPTLTTTAELTQPVAPADTPAPLPTPTLNVIDDNALGTQYTEWLAILADVPGIDEATYRQIVKTTVLRDKLREALGDEVPAVAEQAHARHILVETEDEANEVIERLNAGEDFAELAEELSTDTGSAQQGGDLGFVPKGRFVPEVDDAVFTLPVAEISDPVETQFGWHIIEVLEREERELSPIDYSQSQRLAFSDWLDAARESAEIEDFWTPDSAPAESAAQ